jgi:molybdate transport system regulatory protein
VEELDPMELDVRIMLRGDDGETFMGVGVFWLLQGIQEHHSISQAARDMDLSYPKALRMLRNLEAGLGQPIVVRHRGGATRGGAELTAAGEEFLARYEKLEANVRRYAEAQFKKHFGQLLA